MCLFARGQGRISGDEAAKLRERLRAVGGKEKDDGKWEIFYEICGYTSAAEQSMARELTLNLQEDIIIGSEALKLLPQYLQAQQSGPQGNFFPTSVLAVWAAHNDSFVRDILQLEESPRKWDELLRPQGVAMRRAEVPGDHWSMLSQPANVGKVAEVILPFFNTSSKN